MSVMFCLVILSFCNPTIVGLCLLSRLQVMIQGEVLNSSTFVNLCSSDSDLLMKNMTINWLHICSHIFLQCSPIKALISAADVWSDTPTPRDVLNETYLPPTSRTRGNSKWHQPLQNQRLAKEWWLLSQEGLKEYLDGDL